MVDYSCEECLKYGQTSRCTHCKKMVCSSCRESHKGDLQKSVIDSITGLQQMSASLSAEWSVVNNKISAIISQCDIFCSTSKRNLRKSLSLDNLESTGEHVSECGKKLQQIQTIIRQLPSDIPDMDLAGLSITTGETTSASVVSTAVMAQWLGCRTRKHKVVSSSPVNAVSSLGIGSLKHNSN